MPHINEMKSSKFLKKEDVGTGKLFTIVNCEQMNVARESDPEELKWCLNFEEEEKPFVMNQTNIELVALATGEQNSDNWAGHKIVLYDDPTIMFAAKRTGGIRVRPSKQSKNAVTKQTPVEMAGEEDEIPFN